MSRKLAGIVIRSVRALTARKTLVVGSSGASSGAHVRRRRQDASARAELGRERRLQPRARAQQRRVARRRQRAAVAQPPQHAAGRAARRPGRRAAPRARATPRARRGCRARRAARARRSSAASGRRSIAAPAAASASSAAAKAAATAGSASSTRSPSGTTRRSGGAPRARRRRGRRRTPRSAASSTTGRRHVAASGPTLSSDGASGRRPARSMRAADGLKPAIPQNAAGTRIEPEVSVPIATRDDARRDGGGRARRRAARHARPLPRGLAGVPKCGFRPSPENASSLRFVLPTQTIPAAASRATTGASAARRRRVAPQRRRRRRRRPGDVDQVLPRDGHAVERPARRARPQPRRARGGLAPRPLLRQRR